MKDVTVIRWEVAGKWFPRGLTANQGNKNGHTGTSYGFYIPGYIFPSSSLLEKPCLHQYECIK